MQAETCGGREKLISGKRPILDGETMKIVGNAWVECRDAKQ